MALALPKAILPQPSHCWGLNNPHLQLVCNHITVQLLPSREAHSAVPEAASPGSWYCWMAAQPHNKGKAHLEFWKVLRLANHSPHSSLCQLLPPSQADVAPRGCWEVDFLICDFLTGTYERGTSALSCEQKEGPYRAREMVPDYFSEWPGDNVGVLVH